MTVSEQQMANAIRVLAMDAVQAANSGHPGMPMGMADVATVLYCDYLKFDPADPHWPDRDRLVLSAGHGSMLAYATLHLSGYAKPTMDDIRNFRQLHSPCAGHPENFELAGIEATTGPLGQGLAMAVGMAIAERHLNTIFGDELVDHKSWVIAGDGCLMEGINHEAIGLAGHLQLGRLNVLWDDNRITIDGAVDLSSSEDIAARYRATGWHVVACDGHDFADIRRAIDEALADPRPSLIACRTIIGYGAPNKQGSSKVHGSPLGEDEIAATRSALGWGYAPFEIPADVREAWLERTAGGKNHHLRWQSALATHSQKDEFERRMSGEIETAAAMSGYMAQLVADRPKAATRKSSEMALGPLTDAFPELLGGSADLTGSNNTKTTALKPLNKDDYSGRYIYYGIREFGMAAAMNGMALHGGIIPFGGTFLIFSDYARPAIRLSALQGVRVVYVLTHDSIGQGEDGPTHQPVEHLQSLRMIPNLEVFRPCDAIEVAECWQLALARKQGPSVLALSRQDLEMVRTSADENLSAKGAYRIASARSARRVIIVATGSEVALAVDVAKMLEDRGVGADVVSMPSISRFKAQDFAYRSDILPDDGSLRVSIEAGTTFGWSDVTGSNALHIGIDRFGASAPGKVLMEHFGFSAEKITPQIIARLG
ncbi:MAG: transketolase [Sphingomonadaceae bacterium]|nr:transketolase [Sphingomonadaceae bacterium]